MYSSLEDRHCFLVLFFTAVKELIDPTNRLK